MRTAFPFFPSGKTAALIPGKCCISIKSQEDPPAIAKDVADASRGTVHPGTGIFFELGTRLEPSDNPMIAYIQWMPLLFRRAVLSAVISVKPHVRVFHSP